MNAGTDIVPALEKAWENSLNELFHQRIETIVQKIQLQSTYNELSNWKHSGGNDLLKGAFLVAKYQYPDITFSEIEEKIENIRKDAWIEMNDNLTALENVKILNHVIYNIHRFSRNSSNFFSPQNSYINSVLETKKGNPLTLSIIYAVIGQKLKLPVYGVNLPKNFILAYKDTHAALWDFEGDTYAGVLFYINPYNKGAVFGKKEIDHFIEQQKLEPRKEFYTPCSNVDIIQRLINNLIESYNKLGYADKIKELTELLNALE